MEEMNNLKAMVAVLGRLIEGMQKAKVDMDKSIKAIESGHATHNDLEVLKKAGNYLSELGSKELNFCTMLND